LGEGRTDNVRQISLLITVRGFYTYCRLMSLPETIGNLTSLYRLGLKSNQLEALPESFGGLTSLVELFLTDNCLRAFPASISQCTSLVKFQASFNQLESLPREMGTLPSLELLRVAVNSLTEVCNPLARMNNTSETVFCQRMKSTSPQHDYGCSGGVYLHIISDSPSPNSSESSWFVRGSCLEGELMNTFALDNAVFWVGKRTKDNYRYGRSSGGPPSSVYPTNYILSES
jgi:hypothetical protein